MGWERRRGPGLVLGAHGPADVDGGEDGEDVGLEDRDQDLERREEHTHSTRNEICLGWRLEKDW